MIDRQHQRFFRFKSTGVVHTAGRDLYALGWEDSPHWEEVRIASKDAVVLEPEALPVVEDYEFVDGDASAIVFGDEVAAFDTPEKNEEWGAAFFAIARRQRELASGGVARQVLVSEVAERLAAARGNNGDWNDYREEAEELVRLGLRVVEDD